MFMFLHDVVAACYGFVDFRLEFLIMSVVLKFFGRAVAWVIF